MKHPFASIPRWPALMLFVSLVMHGIVLWMPIASDDSEQAAQPSEEVNVRVVRLPKPLAQPTQQVPIAPIARPKASPKASVRPQPTVTAIVKQARSPRPSTSSLNTPSPAPSPTPTPVVNPDPTPTPTLPIQPNDLLVDLSQLAGTTPCQQVKGCWTAASTQWRSVKQDVTQQIETQGYTVNDLELENDTGFKVSQVSHNGQTKYYLHLISTLQGTVFLLDAKQLSQQEAEAKARLQKPLAS